VQSSPNHIWRVVSAVATAASVARRATADFIVSRLTVRGVGGRWVAAKVDLWSG